ncbi:MAG: MJ0042 family finger-like protein [Gallionellaceae bacterium]|nr:MAG: MJ0042 family finger-like protein [Gallionellaceae bacterium]
MSDVTQCPECTTRFRVSEEQLTAHDGLVRCGRCHEVFNAREHMQDDEPSPQLSLPIEVQQPIEENPTPEDTSPALIKTAEEALEATETDLSPIPDVEGLEEPPFTLAQQVEVVEELTEEVQAPAPRKHGWVGVVVAVLLALTLVAQAAYFYRVELAAHLPGLKPLLTQYCGLLDCTVDLPRQAESMSIESSELESDRVQNNLVTLHALLHNRAPYAQAYPNLELTLTDTQDAAIARRVFQPADYLKTGDEMQKGLAANRELALALRIDTSDLRPAGYRLFLFYPQ